MTGRTIEEQLKAILGSEAGPELLAHIEEVTIKGVVDEAERTRIISAEQAEEVRRIRPARRL